MNEYSKSAAIMCFLKSRNWLVIVLLVVGVGFAHAEDEDASEEVKEETKQPRVAHIDIETHAQQALVEELRNKDIVWLDVEYPMPEGGSASSENIKALALQKPSHKAQQHGAVLILPEVGQHADWPSVIRPLRSKLPESGWYTLSLSSPRTSVAMANAPKRSLPVKPFDEIELSPALVDALANRGGGKDEESNDKEDPTSEDAEVSEDDQENELVDIDLADKSQALKLIPYEDKALAHVNAGMDYLRNQGYQNIVLLAYRSSANVALEYIKQKQGTFSDKGFAFVLVDPVFNDEYKEDPSEALGKNFPAPILEIVNTEEDESTVKSRLAFARVNGALRYMQVNYAFQLDEGTHKGLVRRVRFWLEKHAPGMIVGPGR